MWTDFNTAISFLQHLVRAKRRHWQWNRNRTESSHCKGTLHSAKNCCGDTLHSASNHCMGTLHSTSSCWTSQSLNFSCAERCGSWSPIVAVSTLQESWQHLDCGYHYPSYSCWWDMIVRLELFIASLWICGRFVVLPRAAFFSSAWRPGSVDECTKPETCVSTDSTLRQTQTNWCLAFFDDYTMRHHFGSKPVGCHILIMYCGVWKFSLSLCLKEKRHVNSSTIRLLLCTVPYFLSS